MYVRYVSVMDQTKKISLEIEVIQVNILTDFEIWKEFISILLVDIKYEKIRKHKKGEICFFKYQ